MDEPTALTMLRWCRRRASAAIVYGRSGIYTDRVNAASEMYAQRSSSTPLPLPSPEEVSHEGIYKILLLGLPLTVRRAAKKAAQRAAAAGGLLCVQPGSAGDRADGRQQGRGARARGGDPRHTARGNHRHRRRGNDISMLRWAGLGIAMANAPENVKAAADVIAPACDEDGAAWAMEKYLLLTCRSYLRAQLCEAFFRRAVGGAPPPVQCPLSGGILFFCSFSQGAAGAADVALIVAASNSSASTSCSKSGTVHE